MPRSLEHLLHQGESAIARSDWKAAREAFEQAAELEAGSPSIWNNLGAVCEEQGDLETAESHFARAAELRPLDVTPYQNLAALMQRRGAHAEAVDALHRVVVLTPADGDAWLTLGLAMRRAGQVAHAMPSLTEAVRHLPDRADAWLALGHSLLDCKEAGAAIDALRRCLEIDPGNPTAHYDLGKAYAESGEITEALDAFRAVLASEDEELRRNALRTLAILAPGSPREDHASVRAIRNEWSSELPVREQSAHRPTVGSEPIRVAYLSSFFQDANWMKPVFGLINAQDRSAFALHLFTDSAPEAIGSGYRRHDADRVHDIRRLDAAQVAEQMRSLGIDILIDLNGYSDPERLEVLTQQPCEAIVEWFNMYATSGIERVGWLIGDEAVIRPEEEAQYGESILRVPGSYLTFEPEPGVPDAATATTSDAFTFGCLASMYKFTDEVLDDWARILAKAPDSRLLLRNRGLDSRSNRERLCSRFAARGIAADRLELLPGCDHFAFLQTYERIDLALDTYPYNGGTTTTEALWQGVPVLTFDGDRWASRTSKSLLLAAGLGRFVAANRKDLVASAVAFASDARLRQELVDSRPVMRDRLKASPVCDTQSFARAMEDLYRRILGRS